MSDFKDFALSKCDEKYEKMVLSQLDKPFSVVIEKIADTTPYEKKRKEYRSRVQKDTNDINEAIEIVKRNYYEKIRVRNKRLYRFFHILFTLLLFAPICTMAVYTALYVYNYPGHEIDFSTWILNNFEILYDLPENILTFIYKFNDVLIYYFCGFFMALELVLHIILKIIYKKQWKKDDFFLYKKSLLKARFNIIWIFSILFMIAGYVCLNLM